MQTEIGLPAPRMGNFGLILLFFLFTGVGTASTFRQYPIIFSRFPRQGAGVIGWIEVVAAYGPFFFATLIGIAITTFGSPIPFFLGIGASYIIAAAINCSTTRAKDAKSRVDVLPTLRLTEKGTWNR